MADVTHTATLTVPAKYADDFRAAATHELGVEAGLAQEARAEYLAARNAEQYGGRKADDESWQGLVTMLDRDAAIYRQAVEQTGDLEINVADDKGTVAFVCETVARKIVGPQLMEALNLGPIDRDYTATLYDLIDRLRWAIDAAAEVQAGYFPEGDKEENR